MLSKRALRSPRNFRILIIPANGGEQSEVRVVASDRNADLIALRIVGGVTLRPSVLNARPVGVGHQVFILGFPKAADDLRDNNARACI